MARGPVSAKRARRGSPPSWTRKNHLGPNSPDRLVARSDRLPAHRQSRRDRLPHHPHRAADGGANDRGLFRGGQRRPACARGGRGRRDRAGAGRRELSRGRQDHRRRQSDRRGGRSSRLRLPRRERRLRRGRDRRRADLGRAAASRHSRHGSEGRRQAADGRGGRSGHPRLSRRRSGRRRPGARSRRHRLAGDDQGGCRRWRQGHAQGGCRAALSAAARLSARREAASAFGDDRMLLEKASMSTVRATSRCRCSEISYGEPCSPVRTRLLCAAPPSESDPRKRPLQGWTPDRPRRSISMPRFRAAASDRL